MPELLTGILYITALGIITAIAPCPLTTNIAAMSFIGQKISHPRQVLHAGLAYAIGRTVSYTVIGIILAYSTMKTSQAADIINRTINTFMGPLFILAGMFMLQMISLNIGSSSLATKFQSKFQNKSSVLSSFFMGVIFALSFCPTTAQLFLVTTLAAAQKYHSPILLPMIYGFSTGIPVIAFAFVIAFSANKVAPIFNRITSIEKYLRKILGTAFIILGLYLCDLYIFHLLT